MDIFVLGAILVLAGIALVSGHRAMAQLMARLLRRKRAA